MAEARAIALDIFADFVKRQQAFSGKALVVVSSIESARQLCSQLREEAAATGVYTATSIAMLSSSMPTSEVALLLHDFIAPGMDPLMVISVKIWTGIDAPLIHCVYLTCKLGQPELARLVGTLLPRYFGKMRGVLIDYADNQTGNFT
jgi:hypothetical protein